MKSWLLWLVAAVAACGPSSAQLRTAKSATYAAPNDLFDVALTTTQKTYKLGEIDAENRRFMTEQQFYSPEGGRQSPGAGGFVNMSDRTVMLSLFVEIVPIDGGQFALVVTPVTFQVISGSPKPRELKPDDPNLPPWVGGRVDSLSVAIYEAAKQQALTP